MTLTLDIPQEVEIKLRAEAVRQGVEPSVFAAKLLQKSLEEVPRPAEGSLGELFAQWAEEDATDDPAEIARRIEETEELKVAMNRNRLESDGPNARIPFP